MTSEPPALLPGVAQICEHSRFFDFQHDSSVASLRLDFGSTAVRLGKGTQVPYIAHLLGVASLVVGDVQRSRLVIHPRSGPQIP